MSYFPSTSHVLLPFASSRVRVTLVHSFPPRGTRAAGPWGSPCPHAECAPRAHSGQRGGRSTPPPFATARTPRVPDFQFARLPPAPRRGPARPTRFPEMRWTPPSSDGGG